MEATLAFAREQDSEDPLRSFRDEFHFPERSGRPVTYLLGNSLGLQPRAAAEKTEKILDSWRTNAIDGYWKGDSPWMSYGERFKEPLAKLTGALAHEVCVMNTLTVNLHLLLCTFYRPTAQRFKVIVEAGAFPSDQYAAETQVRFHGLVPENAIIEVSPRAGKKSICEEDLLKAIKEAGQQLALVLIGGVSYYTGQFFDLQKITEAAHEVGALAGYDLAHAVGNVPLHLHKWNADFAVWCSYKYLNGGPGASGAIYIHERYSLDPKVHRFGGWGGSEAKTRFLMPKTFVPEPGAEGWSLSNAQGLVMGGLEASLELFGKAGFDRLRAKSVRLTAYLEYLLDCLPEGAFEVITPREDRSRGAQLSLYFNSGASALQAALAAAGVITDYREPGVIRLAPAPLYNSFQDVYRCYEALGELL